MTRDIHVPPVDPAGISPPSREIFARMGQDRIFAMLEDFYGELERASPALRALFPADMPAASRRSAAFYVGLLGGPPLYHERYGNPMMRARHLPFPITVALRDEWLACFNRVLDRASERHAFPAEHLAGFREFLRGFSMWMVNAAE